ncbi:hypothetical protein [Pseudorhodoferax sp. Leaf267]|jgi:hypothetical protein|uniref:hypothetical protein n=1 Tax=Pseudorhodoferax sp. Leaf267 TaxID=1736316 RepID=UPI0006F545B8|nr:hypothetical protein [Pseudorhodoferax sp. Leaf267]KQP14867.1 hypothetical protein ASF43_12465 [Pseudorhodoferax sp. Leaf267]
MKNITDPRHYDINANFTITLPRDDRRGTKDVVQWLESCLNAQPDAEVEITLATGRLCWADFIDAPMFGPEDPDYSAAVELLNKVEAWLTLDRKALIFALIQQKCEIDRLQRAQATTAAQAG